MIVLGAYGANIYVSSSRKAALGLILSDPWHWPGVSWQYAHKNRKMLCPHGQRPQSLSSDIKYVPFLNSSTYPWPVVFISFVFRMYSSREASQARNWVYWEAKNEARFGACWIRAVLRQGVGSLRVDIVHGCGIVESGLVLIGLLLLMAAFSAIFFILPGFGHFFSCSTACWVIGSVEIWVACCSGAGGVGGAGEEASWMIGWVTGCGSRGPKCFSNAS